jgi:hypothetical protein
MRIEIKSNFTEVDQVMFEAELQAFYDETEEKVKLYVR